MRQLLLAGTIKHADTHQMPSDTLENVALLQKDDVHGEGDKDRLAPRFLETEFRFLS